MLRDTVAPTMLRAGIRPNVIPSEARAVINVRLLPGNQLAPLLAKLQQLVNDPGHHVRARAAAVRNCSVLLAHFRFLQHDRPASPPKVIPALPSCRSCPPISRIPLPLRLRNVQAYGLLPFPLNEDDMSRFHADNERIPLDSFHKGVEFLFAIVSDFSVTK